MADEAVIETPAQEDSPAVEAPSSTENNSHPIDPQPEFTNVDLKIDNFSDMLSAAKSPGKKALKAAEAEAPKVEDEPPAKEDEKVEEPIEPKVDDVEVTPKVGRPPAEPRDYSIFKDEAPAEIEHLKKMSNAAFNKYKKLYKENEELKARPPVKKSDLPEQYYNNPNGYLLDPKYGETQKAVETLDKVALHWKRQEINIRKNSKIRDLFYNDKGELTVGEERDATDADEEEVFQRLTKTNEQLGKFREKLDNIVTSFKDRHENDVGIIKDAEAKFFPDFDKKDHPTRQLQDNVIANLPESMRDHPLASLVAKLTASNALLVAQAQELKKKGKTVESIKEDSNGAPPPKGKFTTGNRGPVKLTSFADFDRIKRGEM